VTHVAPEFSWQGKADQRVHVGAVDIHLAAMVVDDIANPLGGLLAVVRASSATMGTMCLPRLGSRSNCARTP